MKQVVVTLDVDWAPDFIIDAVAGLLLDHGVRATWFVTHASPAIDRLREHAELFELGIHPNFLPGSSHGDTPEAVLEYCMSLAPGAVSMRTHCLAQSTPLLADIVARTNIALDASLFLPRQTDLQPVVWWLGPKPLTRVAHWWEDDIELLHPEPVWDLDAATEAARGVVVYDFHPIHVYLNSATAEPYENLKREIGLAAVTRESCARYVNEGVGAGTAFRSLVHYLSARDGGSRLDHLLAPQRNSAGAST